jgi:hypothetical protein
MRGQSPNGEGPGYRFAHPGYGPGLFDIVNRNRRYQVFAGAPLSIWS